MVAGKDLTVGMSLQAGKNNRERLDRSRNWSEFSTQSGIKTGSRPIGPGEAILSEIGRGDLGATQGHVSANNKGKEGKGRWSGWGGKFSRSRARSGGEGYGGGSSGSCGGNGKERQLYGRRYEGRRARKTNLVRTLLKPMRAMLAWIPQGNSYAEKSATERLGHFEIS